MFNSCFVHATRNCKFYEYVFSQSVTHDWQCRHLWHLTQYTLVKIEIKRWHARNTHPTWYIVIHWVTTGHVKLLFCAYHSDIYGFTCVCHTWLIRWTSHARHVNFVWYPVHGTLLHYWVMLEPLYYVCMFSAEQSTFECGCMLRALWFLQSSRFS